MSVGRLAPGICNTPYNEQTVTCPYGSTAQPFSQVYYLTGRMPQSSVTVTIIKEHSVLGSVAMNSATAMCIRQCYAGAFHPRCRNAQATSERGFTRHCWSFRRGPPLARRLCTVRYTLQLTLGPSFVSGTSSTTLNDKGFRSHAILKHHKTYSDYSCEESLL